MSIYYKNDGGMMVQLEGLVRVGTLTKNAKFLTEEEASAVSAYPIDETEPTFDDDNYQIKTTYYELSGNRWLKRYELEDRVYTLDDFDQALEDHLLEERYARGYTTREPSVYRDSENVRWAQDAIDWTHHVDDVMEYGLSNINSYRETGYIPRMSVFKAGIPKIVWTYE